MLFKNHCELKDGHYGEIILAAEGENIGLFGLFSREPVEATIEDFRAYKAGWNLRRAASDLLPHNLISHTGKGKGGASVFVKGNTVFIWGYSVSFGPINIEEVSRCLRPDWVIIYEPDLV